MVSVAPSRRTMGSVHTKPIIISSTPAPSALKKPVEAYFSASATSPAPSERDI